MAFSVSEFKSKGLVRGGARGTLFQVFFNVPQGDTGIASGANEEASFVCSAAALPEASVGVIEVPYFGRKIKLAGDRTFSNWRTTIMNDEGFNVRAMFEAWSNSMNNMEGNIRNASVNTIQGGAGTNLGGSYKQDLRVLQYTKTGVTDREYLIVGAYPADISAIELDWDRQNTIENFNVTFAYDYWIPVLESSATKYADKIGSSGRS
jgi:hypothetical protein